MKNVLFLCTGNSCRSILAEALLNHLGENDYKAYSAGSFPTGEVNPDSIGMLQSKNLITTGFKSKSWDDLAHINFDIVITVCDNAANETCPVYLGHAIKAHWGIPDPDKVQGNRRAAAFAMAFDQLEQRINALLELSGVTVENLNYIGDTSL